MSEHEFHDGDRVLAAGVYRAFDGERPPRIEFGHPHLWVSVDKLDLIPDDRHRTPIEPEDVREGDVVRIEWGDVNGSHAREGTAYVSALGNRCVEGINVRGAAGTLYLLSRAPTERDEWWPPQPGDTISDDVGRVTRGRGDRWFCLPDHPDYGNGTPVAMRDADVPADAVLVLPAQTREATS